MFTTLPVFNSLGLSEQLTAAPWLWDVLLISLERNLTAVRWHFETRPRRFLSMTKATSDDRISEKKRPEQVDSCARLALSRFSGF